MKAVNVEPSWPMMFDLAVAQVKAVVAKDDTRDFIVEMLEFGKRLYDERRTRGKKNGIPTAIRVLP